MYSNMNIVNVGYDSKPEGSANWLKISRECAEFAAEVLNHP